MRLAKLLPIAAAGAFGCAQGGETDFPDAVAADASHYKVQFENDVARVLRTTYGAGERSVMHHHPAHCAVSLNDGTWQMTDPAGEVVDVPVVLGELLCFEETVHRPENMSEQPGEAILFEFKEGGTAGTSMGGEHPDAVVADSAHYAVEFESEVVRILRITYGPGEGSVMHYHPANCAVDLTDGSWRMTDPQGTVSEDASTKGDVSCGDASAHLPENLSDAVNEVILVEFKGRETFE